MKTEERTVHKVKTISDVGELARRGVINTQDIISYECGKNELVILSTKDHLSVVSQDSKGRELIESFTYGPGKTTATFLGRYCPGAFMTEHSSKPSDSFDEYKRMLQEAELWREAV